MNAQMRAAIVAFSFLLFAPALCAGCRESGPPDIPPPHFSAVPDIDASALEGRLKDVTADLGKGRYQVLIHAVATEDLGAAPVALTADMLDASGASLGKTLANLVLDPMPRGTEHPPIPAGSKVLIAVGVSGATANAKRIVLTPGSPIAEGPASSTSPPSSVPSAPASQP